MCTENVHALHKLPKVKYDGNLNFCISSLVLCVHLLHNPKIAIISCPILIDILIIFLPLNGLLTLWFGDTKVNFKINYTITYVAITEYRANRLWVRTITFS